jgi:hypothetical protein
VNAFTGLKTAPKYFNTSPIGKNGTTIGGTAGIECGIQNINRGCVVTLENCTTISVI